MREHHSRELPTLEELREIVAGITGLEPSEIPADVNLVHLGVDSLGMMRVLNRLRRSGIRLSVRNLATEPTLAAWHRQAGLAARSAEGNLGEVRGRQH